jgi:hypothetical protein
MGYETKEDGRKFLMEGEISAENVKVKPIF